MKKELVALLDTFKSNEKIAFYDVSRRKQAIVLRVLNILGWETFDVEEVYPDYPVMDGCVDFALRSDNQNKVFILVIGPEEDMLDYEMGLVEVAREGDADIAILTNGIEWWFYLPDREEEDLNFKFHNLQINRQDSDELARKFITFLSKDWVLKGKSVDSAEKVFRSRKKKRLIREALLDIWNEFTRSADNDLVRFLAKESEKVSGYPPEPDDVVSFLRSVMKKGRRRKGGAAGVPVAAPAPVPVVKEAPEKKRRGRAKAVKHEPEHEEDFTRVQALSSRSGAFIGKKPESFTFLGRRHKVKKWKEVLINVCNILSKAREKDFDKVLDLTGRKRKYFSKNPAELKEPRQVNGTDIFVETNFNASNLYMIAIKVLKAFGYSEEDLVIETK